MSFRPFALLLLFSAAPAFAGEPPQATFVDEQMIAAECLPRPENGQEITRRYDVQWTKWFGNGESPRIVAGLIAEAERLTGRVFMPFARFAVEVDTSFRIRGLQSFDKELGRHKVTVNESGNAALLAHEMGHLIGNSPGPEGLTWYRHYFAAVPEACHFTEYAAAGFENGKRNEEFAEVFAAYMTGTKTLRARCGEAFKFMRHRLFPKGAPRCL